MMFSNKNYLEKQAKKKEVVKRTDLALSNAFQSLSNNLKNQQVTQDKELFLPSFCELLKNHQFSCAQEPLETRLNNPQFAHQFMQFLNMYGVKFADGPSNGS